MSNADILSRLEQKLAPLVADKGVFLEGVTLSGPPNRRTLRVTVDLEDGPGGLSSDVLEDVTREISDLVDTLDPLPGAYQLEVTTPGVDRPLTTPRHFRRNIGRIVKITTSAEETVTGRIGAVEESDLTLATDTGPRTLSIDEVVQATVELEFRPKNRGAHDGN